MVVYILIGGKSLFLNSKSEHVSVFLCTGCTEGWYGINCSQQCSGHCRDGTTCNHVSGQCDGRCDAGWTQFACDKGIIILCFSMIRSV